MFGQCDLTRVIVIPGPEGRTAFVLPQALYDEMSQHVAQGTLRTMKDFLTWLGDEKKAEVLENFTP